MNGIPAIQRGSCSRLGVSNHRCRYPMQDHSAQVTGKKITLDHLEFHTVTGQIRLTSSDHQELTGVFQNLKLGSAAVLNCSQSSNKVT